MAELRRTLAVVAAAAMACAGAGCGGDDPAAPAYSPTIDPAAFSSTVDNPFLPLRQGMSWEYRSQAEDGTETTTVAVTDRTRVVMGVVCVEVRDTVRLNGEVIEDTFDWYAQHRDGTVWYFGEDTKEYEGGKVVSTEGSWEAGVDGAQPGVVMPAQPRVGDRYRQEYYRGEAEDMAEVLSVTEHVRVPTGSYDGVVQTRDTTPLEPKLVEHKYYARGIGPVLTVDVAGGGTRDELVHFTS
ncbi:MAG TPA: hypothetical protein VFM54_01970 [Micromonosporaceae bacterium]|nr:hypothetical protein [Micromonosporaceae bacterium]